MNNNKGSGLILFIVVLVIMSFMFFVLYHVIDDTKYTNIASSMDCDKLGSTRDLPQIVFFDCKGEIRMYRIKTANNK